MFDIKSIDVVNDCLFHSLRRLRATRRRKIRFLIKVTTPGNFLCRPNLFGNNARNEISNVHVELF